MMLVIMGWRSPNNQLAGTHRRQMPLAAPGFCLAVQKKKPGSSFFLEDEFKPLLSELDRYRASAAFNSRQLLTAKSVITMNLDTLTSAAKTVVE